MLWLFATNKDVYIYYDTGSLKKSYIVRSLYNCVILCITCRLCGACVCRILIKITYLLTYLILTPVKGWRKLNAVYVGIN